MLLTLYEDGLIEGETASFWRPAPVSRVFGRVVGKATIELSFVSSSAYESAIEQGRRVGAFDECLSIQLLGTYDHCGRRIIRSLVLDEGGKPLQTTTYQYKESAWSSKKKYEAGYDSFELVEDYNFGGVEVRLLGHAQKQTSMLTRSAVETLFDGSIVRYLAGIPPWTTHVNPQLCKQMGNRLKSAIRAAGNWEVEVEVSPRESRTFEVSLKSHSTRERFYKAGYWWKVKLQVEFRANDDKGTCSKASVYLYESIVCPATIENDPDKVGRDCFEHIHASSNAEYKLLERLVGTLQKEFGAAPPLGEF